MSNMIHQKRCGKDNEQEERKKGIQENTGRGPRTLNIDKVDRINKVDIPISSP